MSDNFFDTEFGVTLEGHLNLLSGQTHGAVVMAGKAKSTQLANGTVIANMQPFYDDCAVGRLIRCFPGVIPRRIAPVPSPQ
jgi:phospholipase C